MIEAHFWGGPNDGDSTYLNKRADNIYVALEPELSEAFANGDHTDPSFRQGLYKFERQQEGSCVYKWMGEA